MELKPCPFCGGNAHLEHHIAEMGDDNTSIEEYTIRCWNCDYMLTGLYRYKTEKEIVELWNRRVG